MVNQNECRVGGKITLVRRLLRTVLIIALVSLLTPYLSAQCVEDSSYDSHMAYGQGAVFSYVGQGRFIKIDLGHRRISWRVQEPDVCGYAGSVLTDDKAIVLARTLDGKSKVIALSEGSGATLWSLPFSDIVRTSGPVTCDRELLLNEYHSGIVTALDVRSGKIVWDTRLNRSHFFHPPGVRDSELLYVYKKPEELIPSGLAVLDCGTGKVLTELPISEAGISERPALPVNGSNAILTSAGPHSDTFVTLYDLHKQQLIWRLKLPVRDDVGFAPTVRGNEFVLGVANVWILDLGTGVVSFRYPLKGATNSPVVFKESVVFETAPDTLTAIGMSNHAVLWRFRAFHKFMSNFVLCGNDLCVRTSSKLLVVSADTGKLKDSISLPAQ